MPWWAPLFPRPSAREGCARPGLLGTEPLTLFSDGLAAPQSRNDTQGDAVSALRDMQAIAALTASWGERVCELAPHLDTPLGEMAA